MRVDSNSSSIDIYKNYTTLNQLISNAKQRVYSSKTEAPAAENPVEMASSANITTKVRNINMTARNTQEAVSLVSTADGATEKIQDILQRMDSLAQEGAAYDISNSKRVEISSEYDNMLKEINNISQQTTFGGSRILDGSLSSEGAQRSAATEGLYVESSNRTAESVMSQQIETESRGMQGGPRADAVVDFGRMEIVNARAGEKITVNFGDKAVGASLKAGRNTAADIARSLLDSESINLAKNTAVQGDNAALDKNYSKKAAKENAGKAITVNFGEKAVGESLSGGKNTVADVAKNILEAKSVAYQENAFIKSKNAALNSQSVVQMRLQFNNEQNSPSGARAAQQQLNNMNISVSYAAEYGGEPSGTINYAQDVTFTSTAPGVQHGGQPIRINTVNFFAPLRVGDTFRMSGKTFELVVPGGSASMSGASGISIFAAQTNQDVMQAMRNAMAAQFRNEFNIGGSGAEIKIEQKVPKSSEANMQIQMQPAQHRQTKVSFDISRLQTGDQVRLNVSNSNAQSTSNNYLHLRGNSAATMAGALMSNTNGQLSGGAMSFEDSSVSVEFSPAQSAGRSIVLSGGQSQSMQVSVQAANTAALGLDGTSLGSPSQASSAGTATRSAASAISSQRSAMASTQSQLQNRLSSMQEQSSLVAAQGRVGDTQEASNMLQSTLSGLRQQTNIAANAQANSKSQNVLTLLM